MRMHKDCKWLQGERITRLGMECVNPEKQKIWDERERSRKAVGIEWKANRYKQPCGKACSKFTPKDGKEERD